MSLLTSVGAIPGAAYSNSMAGNVQGTMNGRILAAGPQQQAMRNVQLTPVAASAGSLMNNTYQVAQAPPQVVQGAVSPYNYFSAYANSLGSGGPFVSGAQAFQATDVRVPRFEAAAPILAAASDDQAYDDYEADQDEYEEAENMPIVGTALSASEYTPQILSGEVLARTSSVAPVVAREVSQMPIPVPNPIFNTFPQSVPLTAVGTAMLQNAASVTGGIRGGEAAYALNISSLWGGANIRPLFYATPVGFGMTRTCDCAPQLGNCPGPCNFGQAWRF